MRSLDAIPDPNAAARADPYSLRELGDRAARAHVRDNLPVAEAVARAIRESGKRLTHHHVQRVVEYANLRAFRDLRQPDRGKIGRLVDFPDGPALAERVLALLRPARAEGKMGVAEARSLSSPTERARPPYLVKGADAALETYLRVREAEDQCGRELLVLTEKRAHLLGEVCAHAAYALRSGAHLGDIVALVSTGAPGRPDMVKVAMDVVQSLVCTRLGLMGELGRESLEKLSSAERPNPKHPLVLKVAELVRVADALDTAERTTAVLARDRAQVRAGLGGRP